MTRAERQQRLVERLQHGPVLIGDGAMGTQLYHRGAPLDSVFEYLNLLQPDLVSQVHRDYLDAGAELIETNTFGANALRLGNFGLAARTAGINLAGARLAREAAGEQGLVAGSVGPLPAIRASDPELDSPSRKELFRTQMLALDEGGVDCLLLETFGQVAQLKLALEAAAEVGLPAIAQLAFAEGGFTGDGLSVEAAVTSLGGVPMLALGANCGAGPRELLAVIRRLAAVCPVALSAFPNSGFPEYVDGRHIYLATPEYFARLGQEMAEAGAGLIGGCCGTGPEQIAALARVLRERRPGPRPLLPARPDPVTTVARPGHGRRHFLDHWGKAPLITVELDLPRGLDIGSTLQRAAQLTAAKVDAINLAENPLARIRMGNLALAQKIQEQTGTEVIVHVTGRDRNLIGLHSELMGAHLLGIRSVLAVTGDPVAVGGETGASSVFDLNSVGLMKLLSALNRGQNLFGADLEGRTDFLIGAAFNPNPADLTGQLNKLRKKVAAGARFVQTQPVFDPGLIERLISVCAPLEVPVLVGIMPLISERNAEFLHNEVPGIHLPDRVRARMRGKSGAAGTAEGLSLACELIKAARQLGVGGYYLIPPFGRVALALELIREIRQGGG